MSKSSEIKQHMKKKKVKRIWFETIKDKITITKTQIGLARKEQNLLDQLRMLSENENPELKFKINELAQEPNLGTFFFLKCIFFFFVFIFFSFLFSFIFLFACSF